LDRLAAVSFGDAFKHAAVEKTGKGRSPLERMADLTRRIIRVPKGELPLGKQKTKRPPATWQHP